MRVFCPNCGSQNEASDVAGARVTCASCSVTFEAAGATPATPRPPPVAMPPQAPRPQAIPPPPGYTPGSVGSGWVGAPAEPRPMQPISTFGQPMGQMGQATNNPLAIASLVLGVLCFIPCSSLIAIVLGAVALNQIKQSGGQQQGQGLAIAGMVLGGLSLVSGVLFAILRMSAG